MNQLTKLAKPFPDRYVKKPPAGKYGSYVEHSAIAQALLATVGPYSFYIEQVVRGDVPERRRTNKKTGEVTIDPALTNVVVAVIAGMKLTIDGRREMIGEVGDCDDPHNWTTDGQRLKDAASDAFKRCAMRFGCGLFLWAQEDYFLYDSLSKKQDGNILRNGAQGDPGDAAPLAVHETPGDALPSASDEGREAQGESGPPAPKSARQSVPKVAQKLDGPKDPELTAMRIAVRKAAEKKNIDVDEFCKPIGKKLDDMDKSDVELLMQAVKEHE